MSHVLIVDDQLESVEALAELMTYAGHHVSVARDGLAAKDVVARRAPDVIITDYLMPKMDGLALADTVRRAHPRLPIILLTAFHLEGLADARSVNEVVRKPFDADALLRAVARCAPALD